MAGICDEEMAADAEITLAELKSYFKPELWIRFIFLMREVKDKTGFGNITIIISDRRVETIKQEFSYK